MNASASSALSAARRRVERARRLAGRPSCAAGGVVPPENLHVTLAFLGSRPAGDVAAIAGALRGRRRRRERSACVRSATARRGASGCSTFADEGGRAAALAERLHAALEELGVYRREARPWLPHLTVLRFRERPRLRPPLPDLGEVVPSDAAVFISRLRPRRGAVRGSRRPSPLGG